ncbi:preprotein translocase subunit SecG [bacterium]|nr:preprotein translocase subunit SecG [bacterium]
MILVILQAVFALLVIIFILLQEPADDRTSYTSFFAPEVTKRGWEKITFVATLSIIFIFLIISFLRLAAGA